MCFRSGAVWINAIATGEMLDATSSRLAKLGNTVEDNTSTVKGSGLSLALQGGSDFAANLAGSALTHGPLAGLVAQSARLGAFSEANAQGGMTALHFNSQTRNSAAVGLGYQASLDLGSWKPFAKIVWNHELRNGETETGTAITPTTSSAYDLPAAALPRNWATGTIGAKYKLTSALNGYLAASLQSGSNKTGGFGVATGLNLAS